MPLILANQLDLDNRVNCLLAHRVALDPATGVYMIGSYGQRKIGRPRKYVVILSGSARLRFTAYSDEEAVSKANQLLLQQGDTTPLDI